ncbi:MAG: hypothetical protein NDI75_07055 [Candidatus Didemnitutus sp.]|nr:hypothetical protein [Candidatus Didemnitutus sp.]
MTRSLLPPAFVTLIALAVSTVIGLGWFWRTAEHLVAAIAAQRAVAAKQEKTRGWDFWTIEIDNLASELKDEKERLRKAMEQVDQRSARLSAEQGELDKLRAELERMRREIGERVIEINADEAKNLRALAQTYSALTPRAAVAILRELDDITIVKILSLMKPDVVSPIFEEMSRTPSGTGDGTLAKRAATLSEKLRLMKSNKPAAS